MAVADGEEANIRYSEWLQCSQMIMVVFLGKLFDFLLLQNLLLLVTCVCVCVWVYTLPPLGFFRLHNVCDIHEKFGSKIFCCEYF